MSANTFWIDDGYRNEISLLGLVASDAAYQQKSRAGIPLQSLPDSSANDEYSFKADAILPRFAVLMDPSSPLAFKETVLQNVETVEFINWHQVDEAIEDPGTGFGAVIFQRDYVENGNQKSEYIVAFRGSDGRNGKDWFANIQLGKNQWTNVFATLFSRVALLQSPDGSIPRIHFTGQSLGGGLAQYAAYEYVRQRETSDNPTPLFNADFFDQRSNLVTLTTFNGFAGGLGLSQLYNGQEGREQFNPHRLSGVPTAHYSIENDIVHNVGGAFEGNRLKPGFGFLNATDGEVRNLYHFAGWRHWDANPLGGPGTEKTGPQSYLGLVEGHRIESGFYQGLDRYKTTFTSALQGGDYIGQVKIDTLQAAGEIFARFLGGNQSGEFAGWARVTAGIAMGTLFGSVGDVARLLRLVGNSLYNSGDINGFTRAIFASELGSRLSAASMKLLAKPAIAVAGASAMTAAIADLFQKGAGAKQAIDLVNANIADDKQFQVLSTTPINDGTKVAAADSARRLDLLFNYLQPELVKGTPLERDRSTLDVIADNPVTFGTTLYGSAKGYEDTLTFLTSDAQSRALANDNLKVIDFGADLALFGAGEAKRIAQDGTVRAALDIQLGDYIEELSTAVVNLSGDLEPGQSGSSRIVLAPITSYGELRRDIDRLRDDLKDFDLSRLFGLSSGDAPDLASQLERARQAVTLAGEVPVLSSFASKPTNPFSDPDFDPATATIASDSIADGEAGTYVIFLPYEAGETGQRIEFSLSGVELDKLAVLNDGTAVPMTDGAFTLTVAPGRKQVSFAIEAEGLGQSGSVSISATLVDANGIATHKTHLQANLELQYESVTFDNVYTASDHNEALFNGALIPGRSRAKLVGSARAELVSGDHTSELIDAGGGNNLVTEYAFSGSASDPFREGDRINAGSGSDIIAGALAAHVNVGDGDNLVQANHSVGLQAFQINSDGSITPYIGLPLGVFSDIAAAIGVQDTGAGPLASAEGNLEFGYQIAFGTQALSGVPRFASSGTAFELTPYSDGTVELQYTGGDTPAHYLVQFVRGADLANSSDVQIEAGAGNDRLFGAGGADFISGGAGDDRIAGGAGDDTLEAGEGNDQIIAGRGDDFVQGGFGEDRLWGEAGNDELDGGDGNDFLVGDSDFTALAQQGDDYLDGGAGDDTLYGNGGNDELFGGDGTDALFAGLGADYLDGESGNDYLDAGSGDDTLFGGDGSDFLLGGDGSDYLDGERGNDFLDGADGNDVVWAGAGADVLSGGTGSDELHGEDGDDTLDGGEGGDSVEGGLGDDALAGGAGDDTYVFNIGDGRDVVTDYEGVNSIQFGDGVSADTTRVIKGANTVDLSVYYGSGDALLIQNGQNGAIQNVRFADGSSLDAAQFAALAQNGSQGKFLQGGAFADELHAADTDSLLDGQGGDDVIVGGPGNDTLIGGAATNVLAGGAGDDTYVFGLNRSTNTVTDIEGTNSFQFDAGIAHQDLTIKSVLGVSGQHVLQLQYSAEDTITFNPNARIDSFAFADGGMLSRRQLFGEALLDQVKLYGSDQDDELDGGANSDNLSGFGGNDVLYGGNFDDSLDGGTGDDQLIGGKGNDVVMGGSGSDRYYFGRGDGEDTIIETQRDAGDVNTLQFSADIDPAAVTFTHLQIGDLRISIGGSDDSITVRDWYNNADARLDRVVFSDGTEISADTLTQLPLPPLVGTSDDDALFGTQLDEVIQGFAGDDRITGGPGTDTLQGGDGLDTYVFTPGQGRDTILEDAGESSIVQLPMLLQFSEFAGAQEGSDLFVHVPGAGDGFVLKDYYADLQRQWTLRQADGTTKDVADWLVESQMHTTELESARSTYVTRAKLAYAALMTVNGFVAGTGHTYERFPQVGGNVWVSRTWELGSTGQLSQPSVQGESSLFYGHTLNDFLTVEQTGDAADIYKSINSDQPSGTDLGSSLQTLSMSWTIGRPSTISGINNRTAYRITHRYFSGTGRSIAPVDQVSISPSQLWRTLAADGNLPPQIQDYIDTRQAYTYLESIHAGTSDNAIHLGDFNFLFNPSIVDAGPGDDVIYGALQRGWSGYSDMGLSDADWIGDFVYGGDGNDQLYGSMAADVLAGGNGDDYLEGTGGADTYLFFADETGDDLVFDEGSSADYAGRIDFRPANANDFRALEPYYGSALIHPDTVQFGEGIRVSDLRFSWGTASLYGQSFQTLNLNWGADKGARIVLPHPDDVDGAGIEYFAFADGTRLTMADLVARAPAPDTVDALGTSSDEELSGSARNDRIQGGGGDDLIHGNAGDDALFGFIAPNVFAGWPNFPYTGNDALYGGDGDDHLNGREGNNALDGGPGDDQLATIGDNSFLAGGGGDDLIDASYGWQLIGFNPGDGHDVVQRFGSGTISLGTNGADALSLSREGQDLLLHPGSADWVRLAGWYDMNPRDRGDVNLQVIGSGVRIYDLKNLIDRFDALQAQDPRIVSWTPDVALTDSLLSVNADRALGGAIAYQYARFGTTETLAPAVTRATLEDPNWALLPQPVNVVAIDATPVLANSLADQSVAEDSPFIFTVPIDAFFDPDAGDALTYGAALNDGSALPAWLSFDAATRTFSGTPLNTDVGTLQLEVKAADAAGLAASDVFTLTVTNVNDAPTVEAALPDFTATEDQAFSFAVPAGTFADEDVGDSLALSASLAGGALLPGWLSFDARLGGFSGIARNADVGSYDVLVTATDAEGASASDLFRLNVANVNDAPIVAHPLQQRSFEAGTRFTFTIPSDSFADEDARDSLALSAALYGGAPLPIWLNFNTANATFSSSRSSNQNGISRIVVTATDTAGASVTADFGLQIRAIAGASVSGGKGDDVIYGGNGNETLIAKGGNDYLFGDLGDDVLKGGTGDDVLQGGDGADVLRGGTGQNLLDGGSGDDVIYGGKGSSLIVGGTGNDTLRTGQGSDVILFNRGDGSDTVIADRAGDNTLSFGGGIRYSDLMLAKSGKDLVVEAGSGDRVVLRDWYGGGKRSVLNLQMVADASADFDAASADPLRNRRVQSFDFLGMVNAFDQVRKASPGLTSWALTNAILQFHLSGSDEAALGGDLAYAYGRNGAFTGISLQAAQQVIGAPGFGSEAQTLRQFSGLQDGFVKLN